jgi:hypothetical protein
VPAARLGAFAYDARRGLWRGAPVFSTALHPSAATLNAVLVPMDVYAGEDDLPGERGEDATPGGCKRVKYTMTPAGKMLLVGDHVAVRGDDGRVYFALVRDFWRDADGVRRVALRWLLPRPECAARGAGPPHGLCPTLFTLGPVHDRAEMLDRAVVDVFFSPLSSRQPLGKPHLDPTPFDPYAVEPCGAAESHTPKRRSVSGATPLADAIRDGAVALGGAQRRTTLDDADMSARFMPELTPLRQVCDADDTTPAALSDTEADAHLRGRPIPTLSPAAPDPEPLSSRDSPAAESAHDAYYVPDVAHILDDVESAHALCSLF